MSFPPRGLGYLSVNISIFCAFIFFITLARAAHESEEDLPDADDAGSSEPRLSVPEYRSPLSAYQPYDEDDFPGWKQANDRVGEIGGWRVYSREPFESEDDSTDNGEKEKDSQ